MSHAYNYRHQYPKQYSSAQNLRHKAEPNLYSSAMDLPQSPPQQDFPFRRATSTEPHQRSMQLPTRNNSRNGRQHSPRRRKLSDSVSTTPMSITSSHETHDTRATSMILSGLQTKGPTDGTDELEPVEGDDPQSFDLVLPPRPGRKAYSLEERSRQLLSREHLQIIFSDPSLLLRFTAFLSSERPESVPMLIYYLDALKAIKAMAYANAIVEALQPIDGHNFTDQPPQQNKSSALEERAAQAFDVMVNEDLPAYIAHIYIQIVSLSITKRITGTLAPHLREASEGLAEVFCLTDPSRPDNPIVFSSEEFHRTTQYGMSYAIGRNCRFLQGPKTNQHSVRRIKEAVEAGKEHCEVFLNYRRDGSPFMNMLMIAPLCDSRGKIRYFIGAQVDVSGLVKDCTDLESLQRLVIEQRRNNDEMNGNIEAFDPHRRSSDGMVDVGVPSTKKDEFQELSEMLNMSELDTVRNHGGRMHREQIEDYDENINGITSKRRLHLKEASPDLNKNYNPNARASGKLSGVYQHYLLVRPYPSLRILFASPSLRVPGILQSPFMNKIGGSTRVRDELTTALAEGRGVTARIFWKVSRSDEDGRNRWIHCTPLLGSNGHIGVWMIVLVDDEKEVNRRWKQAPPVATVVGMGERRSAERDERGRTSGEYFPNGSSVRSSSPYSLRTH